MKNLADLSIRLKQTLIILLTSSVALLLACAAFMAYDTITFRQQLVEKESSVAQVIGNTATAALDFNDRKAAEESLAALKAEPNIVAACIYDRSGNVFATYQRANSHLDFKFPGSPEPGHKFVRDQLHLVLPMHQGAEISGTIFVASDLVALPKRLTRYAGIVGLVFAASLLIALGVSSRLQRVVSDPILHLAQVARSVALDRNYSVRAQKQSQDELGELIDGFNEMLTQIQQRDAALEAARDNLEQRVAERTKELAKSLSLLNATIESTTDGILALDLSGRVVSLNTKFAAIWNFPADLLARGDASELSAYAARAVKDPQVFQQKVRKSLEHPETETFEVMALNDGRTFERYALPQHIEGKCVGVVINWRDITQRKQAAEAMAISEERFRSVWERSIEGMRLTDRQGKMVEVNEAFCKLMRLPREKLVGQVFSVTYAGHGPNDGLETYVERFDSNNIIPRIEARAELWNSEVVDLEISSSFVEAGQQGRMMLSIFRDVTERRRTEEQLKKVQADLIESSRFAGMAEVASNVLHNVGNVLNSVNVSATLVADSMKKFRVNSLTKAVDLLDQHADELGAFMVSDSKGRMLPNYLRQLSDHMLDEQQSATSELDSLRKNIEHIKEIVTMQQSYAKVAGHTEMLDVTSLIEDSLRMNEGALGRHQVTLIREYDSVPVTTIDKHKVLQILVNLIRNAKYACDEGGQKQKRLTIRLTHDAEWIRISVIDNGVGIRAENLNRIFNHGFTTRRNGHGFGLHSGALAAKEMGGALTVHSDGPGTGATFTLALPICLDSRVDHHAP